LFRDEEESLSKQFHMLPKKRLEKDKEDGIETLVEGKTALTTFKQTLHLHLSKHIKRELAM